jgi:ribonuclease P protein subunit RPR2
MKRKTNLNKRLMKIKENQKAMNATKQAALQHLHTLFRRAREVIHENPELAQRYAKMARKIAMSVKLPLPIEYRRQICRHCKSFILPDVNCRVRTQSRREPHIVVTCLICGKQSRIPSKKRSGKKNDNIKNEEKNKK